jgi:CRISPR-associated exonuclease Cas4
VNCLTSEEPRQSQSFFLGESGTFDDDKCRFTGSQINYYYVCKRKLWLFSHNIELEPESDLVKLGKLLHERSYKRKLKEVQIDRIKVDFMERNAKGYESRHDESATSSASANADRLEQPSSSAQPTKRDETVDPKLLFNPPEIGENIELQRKKQIVIHEVKRSKKMQDAHIYQLLYYVYYLKTNYGVNVSHGVLHYPLLKQNVEVTLDEKRIREIENAMRGISQVNALSVPPQATWKKYCTSCAYRDLCWG